MARPPGGIPLATGNWFSGDPGVGYYRPGARASGVRGAIPEATISLETCGPERIESVREALVAV
jgi:hypothetical protein